MFQSTVILIPVYTIILLCLHNVYVSNYVYICIWAGGRITQKTNRIDSKWFSTNCYCLGQRHNSLVCFRHFKCYYF